MANNPMNKTASRNSFTSVLPTSSFPVSRNQKLQHKFLGVEWKFLEDTDYGDTITLHQSIDLDRSMFISPSKSYQEHKPRSPRSHRADFDSLATILKRTTPRRPNGLIPEEPDTEEDILDIIALQVLDDEYDSIVAKEKLGLIDKKSKQGGLLKQIMGVFQDASDDRFVRRLEEQKKQKEEEERKKNELEDAETDSDADTDSDYDSDYNSDYREHDPTLVLLGSAKKKKIEDDKKYHKKQKREIKQRGSVSLETRIAKTKAEAERLGSALHLANFDPEPKKPEQMSKDDDAGPNDPTKSPPRQIRSTLIDARTIEQFEVELPLHVDRPPSPIVYARSMVPIRIAEDIPHILKASSSHHRTAISPKGKLTKINIMKDAKVALDELNSDAKSQGSAGSSSASSAANTPRNSPRPFGPSLQNVTERGNRQSKAARLTRRTRGTRNARPSGAPVHRGRKLTRPKRITKKRNESSASEGIFATPIYAQCVSTLEKKVNGTLCYAEVTEAGKKNNASVDSVDAAESKPEKVRYGAWYIDPKKWTVGMYNVLNEMAAKQQGSWGVEMANIKAKADTLQNEIPKLFIGKAFTKDLSSKGARIPHFLSRVVVDEKEMSGAEPVVKKVQAPKKKVGTFVAIPEKKKPDFKAQSSSRSMRSSLKK